MGDVMQLGLNLDPAGLVSGGTIADRVFEKMQNSTEETERAIESLVDKLMEMPNVAEAVENALAKVADQQQNVAEGGASIVKGMSDVGTSFDRLSAEAGKYGYTVSKAGEGQEALAQTGVKGAAAMGIVEKRLISVGGEMLGLSAKTTHALGALGQLAVGGGVMLGVSAGIIVLGALYDKMTEKTRKWKEEQTKLNEELDKKISERQAKEDPAAAAKKMLDNLNKQQSIIQEKLKAAKAGVADPQAAEAGLDLRIVDDKKVAKLEEELKNVRDHAQEVGKSLNEMLPETAVQQEVKAFKEMSDDLRAQELGIRKGADAAAKYAITIDQQLTPAHKKELLWLLKKVEAARKEKEEQEKLTRALEAQHEVRVANDKTGGNKLGGDPSDPNWGKKPEDILPDILRGHRGEHGSEGDDITRQQIELAERYKRIWQQAATSVEDAIVGVFTGQKEAVDNFFKNILKSFRDMMAQMLMEAVRSRVAQVLGLIFGAVLKGTPGETPFKNDGEIFPGVSQLPNPFGRGDDERQSIVHVHQNIRFNAGFVDGATGEAWLQQKSGTIAGIIAQAAAESPRFAKHIVANGLRS